MIILNKLIVKILLIIIVQLIHNLKKTKPLNKHQQETDLLFSGDQKDKDKKKRNKQKKTKQLLPTSFIYQSNEDSNNVQGRGGFRGRGRGQGRGQGRGGRSFNNVRGFGSRGRGRQNEK